MNTKKTLKNAITFLLQLEARLVLKKYKPKIVAVTGSVGKTSTKDAIFSVLASSFFVRKSSKSFNNELGVPLTILGLQTVAGEQLGATTQAWLKNLVDGLALILLPHKYPEWLVVEIGADRPGDIKSIASWLHPDVAVVTRLSDVPVHVEFFESADQVRHEKSQLVMAASRAHEAGKKSTVILNADDRLVSSMRPLSKGRVMTFGTAASADVSGSGFNYVWSKQCTESVGGVRLPTFPIGISFNAHVGRNGGQSKHGGDHVQEFPVEVMGALGRQQKYTALAALAVGEALGIPTEKSIKALCSHISPPGRMKILAGVNNSCIIDDTYNSSPVAAREAIETLKTLKNSNGRMIVVLGDMMELGSHSRSEHEKLGKKTAEVADLIFTVGTRAKGIAAAAKQVGFPVAHIFECADSTEAGELLQQQIQSGDIVLLKGSQSVRMEKAVAAILAEPEKASDLLVRQEVEWKNR